MADALTVQLSLEMVENLRLAANLAHIAKGWGHGPGSQCNKGERIAGYYYSNDEARDANVFPAHCMGATRALVLALDALTRDSDGTATAAACEDMPVPQDCQARAARHRPPNRPLVYPQGTNPMTPEEVNKLLDRIAALEEALKPFAREPLSTDPGATDYHYRTPTAPRDENISRARSLITNWEKASA